MDWKADGKVKDRGGSRKWSENDRFEGLGVNENDHGVRKGTEKEEKSKCFS